MLKLPKKNSELSCFFPVVPDYKKTGALQGRQALLLVIKAALISAPSGGVSIDMTHPAWQDAANACVSVS